MPGQNKLITLILTFFAALILAPVLFPSPSHSGSLPGHLLGIVGAILIMSTLIYPYRKHIQKKKGSENPLAAHIYCGLAGPVLVALHAGKGPVASTISTLCYLSLILVVMSGIIGAFLFQRVNRSLKHQKTDLSRLKKFFQSHREELLACRSYFGIGPERDGYEEAQPGEASQEEKPFATPQRCDALLTIAESISELEYTTQAFSGLKTMFSHWILVHTYVSVFFMAMLAVHIFTIVYYGIRWIR